MWLKPRRKGENPAHPGLLGDNVTPEWTKPTVGKDIPNLAKLLEHGEKPARTKLNANKQDAR